MKFEFATATRILFGPGTLKESAGVARGFGSRAFLVIGRDTSRSEPLCRLLKESGVDSVLFPVAGEPEIQTVNDGTELCRREQCALIISFGGGSVIDAGKAIAAMCANPGKVQEYLEVIGAGKSLTQPAAPFIAIPTTAGTGSEVTRNAVIGSTEHRIKVSLRSPLMLPRLAIVDPELTYSLPAAVTASTGMDALTQLIEPYVCARPNPLIDGLCSEGIPRVVRSLLRAFRNGADAAAREDMSLASLFGGLALANAGLGAVHGFAGPFGGMFQAPHGAVCAALLPHVMEANIRALRTRLPQSPSLQRYQKVAAWLTGNPNAKPEDGVDTVRHLTASLAIPSLSAYEFNRAEMPGVVEKAQQASSMKANPITLTREELTQVLEESL